MKERLAEFLRREQLTAVKFAEIMEVQPSSISHLLSGRNKPNFEFISRILLRFPELNPDWIINGQGDIYKSKSSDITRGITNENTNEEVEITDVNALKEGKETSNIKAEQSLDLFSEETEQPVNTQVNGGFTNVNTQKRKPLELETSVEGQEETPKNEIPKIVSERSKKSEELEEPKQPEQRIDKNIARVIVFFTDGSFEEYHNY